MWNVTNLYIELSYLNKYFLLVLRLSSIGHTQTWKALYLNVMFSNDIKPIYFLLAALTVLQSLTCIYPTHTDIRTDQDLR